MFTWINSFDVNKYLQLYIHGDFLVANADYFNTISMINPDGTLTEDIVSQIDDLKGVETTAKVYFETGQTNYSGGTYEPFIYGMDTYWFNILEENITEGSFDKEKFLSGDYILVDDQNSNGDFTYNVGDTISINLDDESNTEVKYEIMAKIRSIYALSIHYNRYPGCSARQNI